MNFGLAAKEARLRKGMTQADVARRRHVDQTRVCKWENGEQMTFEQMYYLAEALDDVWLWMEYLWIVSGGRYSHPRLNGLVRQDPTTTWSITLEEVKEAIEPLERAEVIRKHPDRLTDKDKEDIRISQQQCLDASSAVFNYIAVTSELLKETIDKPFSKHREKWEEKVYWIPEHKKRPACHAGR